MDAGGARTTTRGRYRKSQSFATPTTRATATSRPRRTACTVSTPTMGGVLRGAHGVLAHTRVPLTAHVAHHTTAHIHPPPTTRQPPVVGVACTARMGLTRHMRHPLGAPEWTAMYYYAPRDRRDWQVTNDGVVVASGLSYSEANDYAIEHGLYGARIGGMPA